MKLLLIGMGPGNGISIAKRFGREGYEIVFIARDHEMVEEFNRDLSGAGVRASGYGVSIMDDDAYQAVLDRIVRDHPGIEILHYNASAFSPAIPSKINISQLMSDLKLNIIGAVRAVQAVLPQMRERGRGTIFMTGGGTALHAPAELTSLGIGKSGMRSLVFSLADECKDYGIYVATLTIDGAVLRGSRFDPDLVAEQFWQMQVGKGEVEVIMK